MKVCPKCNQTYADDGLNFCLADGELLMSGTSESPTQLFSDPAPPTLFMDSSRATNPNHATWPVEHAPQPLAPWQNSPQGMQNRSYGVQAFTPSRDQTMPIIALILGILSLPLSCACGGLWLGLPAAIVGYLGMKNADTDPSRYMGRGMAIAGMILGFVSFLASIAFLILQIFAK